MSVTLAQAIRAEAAVSSRSGQMARLDHLADLVGELEEAHSDALLELARLRMANR